MVGNVPPGLAPLPAAWSSFYIAIAEVSATLAGLSFVAVSAHPAILHSSRTRYKAQRTLMTFVVVLVGALILAMPRPPADATTTVLLWSSVAGAALTITSIVRESQSRTPHEWLRRAMSLNSVEYLAAYALAGLWALAHLAPTDQPLAPSVLGAGMVGALGWSALQTWRLMQLTVHARASAGHHAMRDQPDEVLPGAYEQSDETWPTAHEQPDETPPVAHEQPGGALPVAPSRSQGAAPVVMTDERRPSPR